MRTNGTPVRGRRLLAAIGTAALALGLAGLAPAAANAATTQAITGRVVFAASPKLKLSTNGMLIVFTSGCKAVDAKVTWKGNGYTAKVPKAGKYRIVYYSYDGRTPNGPYGLSSRDCSASKSVAVGKGERVAHTVTVRANGYLSVYSANEANAGMFRVYDAKTHRPAGWSGWTHPGDYKLAIVRWSTTKKDYVVKKVFGTGSKRLSKGRTVTLKPARAIRVNFEKGTARSVVDFPRQARISLSGTAEAGRTLTVKHAGFPAGSKFSYSWYSFSPAHPDTRIPGAKSSTFTLTEDEANSSISVIVTVRKTGYLTGYFTDMRDVSAVELSESAPQTVEGLIDDGTGGWRAIADVPITVTPAVFAQSGVTVAYSWRRWDGGGEETVVGTEASYTPTAEETGMRFVVDVTYHRAGSEDLTRSVPFSVGTPDPN